MSSAGKASSANKDQEIARTNFEVQISLANETPYFHAALLESLLQAHLLVNSGKAKFKCLQMALSLLLVPNEHRRADEKNRESVIEKATIVTLVRITKLAIEKKDLDQAALLETVDLLKRNT